MTWITSSSTFTLKKKQKNMNPKIGSGNILNNNNNDT